MSINGWMDKENVVYNDNGIIFSSKREGNPTMCNNMDEPGRHYAQLNKLDTKRQVLHDLTYKKSSTRKVE